MRVRLKGINPVRKQLADGTIKPYWYAWKGKGAPLLRGEPGSPEFVQSYNEAIASRKPASDKTLQSLIDYFQKTTEFTHGIGPRTRSDYVKQVVIIEKKWSDFPISGLADKRARGLFMEWRDELAQKSARQADYAWTVLQRILSVALKRGKIDETHASPANGSTDRRVSTRFGLKRSKRRSCDRRRATFVFRCCSPFGQASGRATCCVFPGRPMTARSFA